MKKNDHHKNIAFTPYWCRRLVKRHHYNFWLLILLFFLFFPQVSFVSSFSIVSCWIYWQDHWNKTKAMNNNVNNRGHRRDNNEEKPAHDRPL